MYLSEVLLELAGLEAEGVVLQVLVLRLDRDLRAVHGNNSTLKYNNITK